MIRLSKLQIQEPDILSILDSFNPIPLYKMNKVALMNRVDTKYVFSVKKLPELLYLLTDKYKVMEIDQLRVFPYRTTYLDTCEYLFYHQHMTGKLERYKIRFRKYESSGVSYLEIKKKTNKNRTIKLRIVNNFDSDRFDEQAISFISENTPYNSLLLKPLLINNFSRATLVGLEINERITFDFNLTFSDLSGHIVGLPFITIAELKKEAYSQQSPFSEVIKNLHIHPTGFSKYCTGSAMLREMPRNNLLKPKLLLINKIENEYNRTFSI